MQCFQGPAGIHETDRQIIEQFWMGRTVTQLAKIAGGSYQTESEVTSPYSIDDHARGERIVSRCDRCGQFRPAASLRRQGLSFSARKNDGHRSRCDVTLFRGIALQVNRQVSARPLD